MKVELSLFSLVHANAGFTQHDYTASCKAQLNAYTAAMVHIRHAGNACYRSIGNGVVIVHPNT